MSVKIYNRWAKRFGGNEDAFSMIPHIFQEFNNVGNLIYIAAGSQAGDLLYSDPQEVANYIKSQNPNSETKILFDNLAEGFFGSVVSSIYNVIELAGVSPSQCYYFVMAIDAPQLISQYCALHKKEHIHVYVGNLWEMHTAKHAEIKTEFVVKPKDKLLVCFNRVLRTHRAAIIGGLAFQDIIDRCYLSFFPNSIYGPANWKHACAEIEMYWNDKALARAVSFGLQSINDRLPLTLNIDVQDNVNYIKEGDKEYFDNSYFSLVTETYFGPVQMKDNLGYLCNDFNSIFFSEKIFKPIVMKHPFILASRPFSLEGLKLLGYQTFSPYINENYDRIEDDAKRMRAILQEVERLSKFNNDEWEAWQNCVKPIVEHNYNVMASRYNAGGRHVYAVTRV